MTSPSSCSIAALFLLSITAVHAQSLTIADCTYLEDSVGGEVDIRADLRIGEGWIQGNSALIVFSSPDPTNYLYLRLDATGAALGRVQRGRDSVLAQRADWPTTPSGSYRLAIKVRDLGIRVLLDGHSFLSAANHIAPGDRIGYAVRGVELADVAAQPIGEMVFHDGFARLPDEPDPWEVLTGTWSVSLPEARNQKADAARSANPFSYIAGGATALSLVGSDYWDGYCWRAAVRPDGPGAVGLAFYAQDAQNCYLFRAWTPAEGETSGNAELVCVLAGEQTVLATGECRVFPGAWSELSVRTHDGKITCLVDDQSVLSAEDDTFAEGRVGLCTQSCEKAAFDDAALEVYREFSDDFEPEAALPIDTVAGEFIVKDGRLLASPDGGQGLAVTGGEQWEDYAVSADITPLGAQAVGLVAGRLSNGTRLLFRWRAGKTPGDPGVQELWDCRPTGRKLLGSRNAELTEGATYHAELMLDRGYARVSVDGQTALEAVVAGRPGAGAVGLQVEGQRQAAFDNLSVRFCDPEKEPVSITDQFSKEDTMANWARPISSWQSIGEDWYTYELPVWGDFSIRMPLAKLGSGAAPWSVEVKAAVSPEALAGTSSAAVLTAEAGRTDLLCTTTGEPLALTSEAEAPQLELQRRGGCLLVSLDGRAMAGGPIAPAPDASVVAVRLKGNAYPLTQATLTSPNIIDETFSSAPTDWTPSAGRWDISDRWNCSPQWSWFCGRDAETPLLWYKWPFTGDLVFEYWGGMMMDLTEAPHYSHPSDLNSVICGDGQNLCSGYGLVFAGDNNTIGRILRRGEAAAVSNEFKWDKPVGANTRFHNMWFHSRVEKLGAHLSYTVDGRAALQYDDPDPLPGGHVGVWTHQKNGILVARARIAFRD